MNPVSPYRFSARPRYVCLAFFAPAAKANRLVCQLSSVLPFDLLMSRLKLLRPSRCTMAKPFRGLLQIETP